jgi:hypothetical protein
MSGPKGEYLDVADTVGAEAFSDEAVEQSAPARLKTPRRLLPAALATAAVMVGLACFSLLTAGPRSARGSGRTAERSHAAGQHLIPAAISLRDAAPQEQLDTAVDTLAIAALGVANAAHNASANAVSGEVLGATDLTPAENLHDGNVCADNEEELGGLCYKKCSVLTSGEAPIRTSPWTCCENHPCGLTNQRGSVGHTVLCKGFDVSGTDTCPHKPGACLNNEEMYLGVCYKRCSILTKDEYPNRVAPATCCKANGITCLDFLYHLKTRPDFAVGGGKGDHDASTPALPHAPQTRLTEEGGASIAPVSAPPQPAEEELPLAVSHLRLKPMYDRHDGNTCEDQEEKFGGLCYKKCELLTSGENPIRTSPWTCCQSHPCGLNNQRGTVGHEILCDGYDISADGSCPHKPGACLEDEELLMGICYEKCSILTNGEFAHRVTPVSCCRESGVDCFDISKVRSRLTYAVGGGKGDHDPSTPALIHAPQVSLTEASARRLQR